MKKYILINAYNNRNCFLFSFLTLIALSSCGSLRSQKLGMEDTNVYVLHGLNSSSEDVELQGLGNQIMENLPNVKLHYVTMSARTSLEERSKEAEDFICDASKEGEPLFLVGHSAGGLIGANITHKFGNAQGLVTINAPMNGIPAIASLDPVSANLAKSFATDLGSGSVYQLEPGSEYIRTTRDNFPANMPVYSIGSICTMKRGISFFAGLLDGANREVGDLQSNLQGSDMVVPLSSQVAVKEWDQCKIKGIKTYNGYAHSRGLADITNAPSIFENDDIYDKVGEFIQDPIQTVQRDGIDVVHEEEEQGALGVFGEIIGAGVGEFSNECNTQ